MGMDAKAIVWLGIRFDDPSCKGRRGDEDELEKYEKEIARLQKINDIEIEAISCNESEIGCGILIKRHYWGQTASELSITDLLKVESKIPVITKILSLMGIEGDVKLWISADYS